MEKKAAVVNVFAKPYEIWSRRKTSAEEALEISRKHGLSIMEALEVKDKLIETVATHCQAAAYMLRQRADNGLEFHIDDALDASFEFRDLRALMPRNVPDALASYQTEFSECGLHAANMAINAVGVQIADGQRLFHGGHWGSESTTRTTLRPFSTSFCPQVALRNAEWRGKAYDAGRLDLMVVRVKQPKTKAYVYSTDGSHGHEKEVVFASGANLTCVNETFVVDYPAYKMTSGLQQVTKMVPAYLIEVEIS
ncbi:hypothetical protein [Delftia tsuruhatensis]|uniref:hypothetical protein n=1 Tax=Delftia tsuruhatensis TaxID=180282 RepID=UPI0031CF542D